MNDPPSRIGSLDALRGAALLGILAVNVQSFAFVAAARWNPAVQGELRGASGAAWLATWVLADGRFIAVFAMLFGAGIVLLAARAERAGRDPARLHYRRCAALLVLGLLHAYLLWYGDWLLALAVCGALAFPYRVLTPGRLLTAGLVIFAIGSALPIVAVLSLPWWPADAVAEFRALWTPSPEQVAWEVARYRGGLAMQMEHRVPMAVRYQTSFLALRTLWQVTGLMLVGMALFRRGILSGEREPAFYRRLAAIGFGAGIPLALAGAAIGAAHGWEPRWTLAVANQLNYWASVPVALGWIGAVMLVRSRGWRLSALAALGRLALSNYVVQTIACTAIFYGHGLGLFARVDRAGQMAIAAAVGAAQLAASAWWVRRFAHGPLEWAWRAVTYGRARASRG